MPPLPPSLSTSQPQVAGHHHDHHLDNSEVSIFIDIDIDINASVDLDTYVSNSMSPHHRELTRSIPRAQKPVIISLKPSSGPEQSKDHNRAAKSKQKPLVHKTLKAIRQAAAPPLTTTTAIPDPTPTKTVLTTHPVHHATLSASSLIGIFLGSVTGLVLLLWLLSFLAARRRRRLLLQNSSASATRQTTYCRGPDREIFVHSLKSAGPPLSPTLTSVSDTTLTATRLGRSGTRRCRSRSRSRSRSHSRCRSRSRSRSHSRHRHHGHCPHHPHCPGHHHDHDHDHEHNHGHWHWHDGHHHHGHHGHHHCLSQDAACEESQVPPVPAIPSKAPNRISTAPAKGKDDCTVTVTEIPITIGPETSPVPRARVPPATRIPSIAAVRELSPLQQNPFHQVEEQPDQEPRAIGTTALNSNSCDGNGNAANLDKESGNVF